MSIGRNMSMKQPHFSQATIGQSVAPRFAAKKKEASLKNYDDYNWHELCQDISTLLTSDNINICFI